MSSKRAALVLLTRPGCGLCEDMQLALAAEQLRKPFDLTIRDVDSDPLWARRWGLKIPVLLADGELVCHGRLDFEALRQAVARG